MNTYDYANFELRETEAPSNRGKRVPVPLSQKTMEERLSKVLSRMEEHGLDALVIYEDLEHGANFEYLTGFLTRFEEAVLVLHRDGTAYLLLGNENAKMVKYSRLRAELIHVPFFSLPNQPMSDDRRMEDYFQMAGLTTEKRVGLVGWKMFTSAAADNRKTYEIPYYIVEAVRAVSGETENRSDLFIGGEEGVRTVNNANEIAHYEYGSALASDCISRAMEQVKPGISELELGNYLNADGQRNTVVTVAAVGERFEQANLYPANKKVKLGDKISLTVGYKGGLSSRSGYAVETREQLDVRVKDYPEKLVIPYYAAVCAWLENIRIGMTGGAFYHLMQNVLPQETYHWSLNPGHLIGDEEWMSSPIYPNSKEILKSGMMLQIDIIPGLAGYAAVGCESGIVLADKELWEQIYMEYPELFKIFCERRNYLCTVLNLKLPDEVIPMNDTVAYYRPFFINKKLAVVKKNGR